MRSAPNKTTRSILVLLIASTVVHAAHAGEDKAISYPVLSGVGVALELKDGRLFVAKVLPESPAAESRRIHPGDRLVSIETNGKTTSLEGKTIGEAASLIRGPVETDLILTVVPQDAETPIAVQLRRAPLELVGVPDSTYDAFIGKLVPELELASLTDESTEQLSDYRGKIVVLDFWASWCPTCYAPVDKMQRIVKSHPQWKDKVAFVTVTVDSDRARAVSTIKEQGWSRTRNLAADRDDLEAIGVSVIPVLIIIRADGTIATMAGSHAADIEGEVGELLKDE